MIGLCGKSSAQFYDSKQDVRFYVATAVSKGESFPHVLVFNFNGTAATLLHHHQDSSHGVSKCKRNLSQDIYFYENKVPNSSYEIKYRRDLSNTHKKVYALDIFLSYFGKYITKFYELSADGKRLKYYNGEESYNSGSYATEYMLVDKDYFLDANSNLKNEIIYE